MKIHLVVALIGLAISFALTAFAQQTNTPDPQQRQELLALIKKFDEAISNNDASALAALFTKDAVFLVDEGPFYGRENIMKHFADLFGKLHFSNWLTTADEYSPHSIGTSGDEMWETGTYSGTIQGDKIGTLQLKGFYSAIAVHEGNVLKKRMLTSLSAAAPAATPSPTTTPSSQ